MRVFLYSLAVTAATAVGLFVISVLQYPVLNTGSTLADAAARMTGVLAFAAILVLPVSLFYMLAVAGVVGVIRRRTWWAGALAGLIPALLFFGVFTLMDTGTTYIGTPDTLTTAGTVSTVVTGISIGWCTLASAALIRLADASSASVRSRTDGA